MKEETKTKGHFITRELKKARFLVVWHLKSELTKGDFDAHERIIHFDELDTFIKSDTIQNDDIYNVAVFKEVDLDFISEE